ncbi:uncharacterized protein DUF3515 [Glaciihabitans tibetensis]|uniref:Uncharacterized protein DUF3515 n=1 Tax=Glaciihabitans tibetensis TaxID=1266600 RepID=A0A2T0VI19_9MICO|nr:DUF3515 family protein [Glaciihabitans tibetensis]PRY69879.1 uncharacterized protein DUF3515 [Glaciihabitans tibetensis]
MRATLRLTALAVLALGLLTGCSQTVPLTPATDAANPECAEVTTRLPEYVAELGQRDTNAQATSAWGSPADVLLYCGVAVPDPTASLTCVTVDGIDWLRDPEDDPNFTFITYGRDPAIAVVVNSENVSGSTALTDLSAAVSIIPSERACVTPDEILEGGSPVDAPTETETETP